MRSFALRLLLVSHEYRGLTDLRLACPRADSPRTAPLPASRARFSIALICRLLFQNQLTGSIPPQLGNMTRLQQMCARFERPSIFVAQPVYAHPVGLRCRHAYALQRSQLQQPHKLTSFNAGPPLEVAVLVRLYDRARVGL